MAHRDCNSSGKLTGLVENADYGCGVLCPVRRASAAVAVLGPHLTLEQMPELWVMWVLQSVGATVVCLAAFHPRIRAVGPLVLSFMLFPVEGVNPQQSVLYLSNQPTVLYIEILIAIAQPLQLGLIASAIVVTTLILALLALIGWFVLHFVGYCYCRKSVSDQSVMLGCLRSTNDGSG
jgi:hypothetical protein